MNNGLSKTREYRAWINMKTRCSDPSTPYWHLYGGRGIKICDRWLSYENFLADMGCRPAGKYSLDRIDVNGDYEPSNCRWTDHTTQSRNKQYHHYVTLNGVQMTLAQAVEKTGLLYNTVLRRLERGWKLDDAFKRVNR